MNRSSSTFIFGWGILTGVMISAMDQPKTPERKGVVPKIKRYVGEVVYIYAFDVAYEMKRQPVRELLGQPVAQFVVDASKRSPRQPMFYRPQMVRMPPLERLGPNGPVRVERVIKLLPVGAISISVRVPFEVQQVEDLVAYHDLQFSNGSLNEEVRRLAEESCGANWSLYYIRPIKHSGGGGGPTPCFASSRPCKTRKASR